MNRHELDPTEFRPNDWEAAERVIRRAEIRSDVRKWSRRVAPFLIVGAVLAGGQLGFIPWPVEEETRPAGATPGSTEAAAGDGMPEESSTAAAGTVPAAEVDRNRTDVERRAAASRSEGTAGRAGDQKRTPPAARKEEVRMEAHAARTEAVDAGDLASEGAPGRSFEHLEALHRRGVNWQQVLPVGWFERQEIPQTSEHVRPWAPRLAVSPLDASWYIGIERAFAGGRGTPRSGVRVWGEIGWDRAEMTATALEDVGVFSYATAEHVAHSEDAAVAAAGCAVERAFGHDLAVAVGVQAGAVVVRRVTVRSNDSGGGVESVSGWGSLEGAPRSLAGPVVRLHWDRWEHLRLGAEVGYRIALPATGSFASFETSTPLTVRLIFSHRP
jgi:hypothetical protein